MELKTLTALFLCTVTTLLAQNSAVLSAPESDSAKRLEFEVASIKLNPGCDASRGLSSRPSPDTFRVVCRTLRQLIASAYGLYDGSQLRYSRLQVVGGPPWVDTDRYDVTAKAAAAVPEWQKSSVMLQGLLEDRFQLRIHTEGRDTSVYVMTAEKDGPGLKRTTEGGCISADFSDPATAPAPGAPTANQPTIRTPVGERPKYCGMGAFANKGPDTIADEYGVTMAQFAAQLLSPRIGRAVVDRTGLAGLFDFHLEFSRDVGAAGVAMPGVPDEASTPGTAPGIIQAVKQQLGLKLTATRAPIDVVMIDHAEKPTEN